MAAACIASMDSHVRSALSVLGRPLDASPIGRANAGTINSTDIDTAPGAGATAVARLRHRGRQCKQRYDAELARRHGVQSHVEALEGAVTTESISVRRSGVTKRAKQRAGAKTLAVLLRGQAFRGNSRDTFRINAGAQQLRAETQALCLDSLLKRLIEPYERTGHHVDVFLTVYKLLGGPINSLIEPLGTRVVQLTTVQQRTTPTQLLPLGAAVRAFLAWCARRGETYSAVVVTRFDLYLKADLHGLMGDAVKIDGFRFLWREAGGHWRHHSERAASDKTFSDRHKNPRAPDALLAFPFAYTRCFLAAVRNEFFPVRNESRPLGFLHNMIPPLRRALPAPINQPARFSYLVAGQFDSNPCRSTCMLNPVYDLLPRMAWITKSNICQNMDDFRYDADSESLCCPSPNYCCPNSISSCRDSGAVFFDALRAKVPPDTIATHWPRAQSAPFTWEMTPASRTFVRGVFQKLLAQASRPPTSSAIQLRHGIDQLSSEPVDFRTALRQRRAQQQQWQLRAAKAATKRSGGLG